MFFVYVIKSKVDNRFYVGLTENVERRLKEHNGGKTRSTKPYVPWELCFFETFNTRSEARSREVYFKSGVGKEYIKRYWTGSSVG
jgi:putative endonuclease